MKYRTILIDPPWPHPMTGQFKKRENRAPALRYPTMSLEEITKLPIENLAETGSHLWLWTTNQMLPVSYSIVKNWGFNYLATVTWIKPSGMGAYFANTTQHMIMGYYKSCKFTLARWRPTHFTGNVLRGKHSVKPEESYKLIESISLPDRIELFARKSRDGWISIGNEIDNQDINEALKLWKE